MPDIAQPFTLGFGNDTAPDPGLIRKPDGSVWLVNPDGTQTKLSSSSAGAVVVSPAASSTNVIVPTLPTVIALTLKGATSQTANLLNVGVDGATPFLVVGAGGAAALTNGSFDPAAYGGNISKLVIAYGSYYGYENSTPVDVGNGLYLIPAYVDATAHITADGANGILGQVVDVALTGSHTAGGAYGLVTDVYFQGTKTAGTGNQVGNVIGIQSSGSTDAAATGDVNDVLGGLFYANLYAPTIINHSVSGVRAYASVDVAAAVASVRVVNGYYAKVSSLGRTVAEAHGLQVDSPTGAGFISVNYGIRVQTQTGAGTSYGISVEGGNNQFLAGAATEVPVLAKGHSGQSANLIEARDSSNTLLAAVTPAGNLTLNSGVGWTVGTGSPEGAVTAPAGSLYTNKSGGAGTTLYVKESGAGNTGWAAK